MKRATLTMLALTAVPLFVASAQDLQHQKLIKQKLEQKAEQKAERKAELKDELAGAPSGEMDVNAFQLKRDELKGKVIELTFDRVISLKQVGQEYAAIVTYQQPRIAADGLGIVIPPEGLDFFQDMARPGTIRTTSVYVQVLSPVRVKALGTRYRKDKPQEELYGW